MSLDQLWSALELELISRADYLIAKDTKAYVKSCVRVEKAQEAIKARILEDAARTGF